MKTAQTLGAILTVTSVYGTVALASGVLPSSGDAFTVYSEVENWTIYSDSTTGTCLTERADSEGNVVQMGLTKDHSYGYIGVFTTADVEIKSKQDVAIAVDGSVFAGESHGIKSKKLVGDYKGGYILADNPDFINAIENGSELVAFPEKTGAFVVDLSGTKRAIEETRKCNMEIAG